MYGMDTKNKILSANARYTAQVEDLFRELESRPHGLLNRKPADNGWSALQVIFHLILVDENSLAYVRKKLSFNPVLKKAGIGASLRSILLLVTLYSPIKFKAPKAASSELIPETGDFEEAKARWRKIRSEWTDFFAQMPADLAEKAAYRHPRAGRLNWLQMLRFLSAHFERHRRQIRRALA